MTSSEVEEQDKVVSNTMLLSGVGMLNRGLTVATQILIAGRFGESIQADAYFATEIIPDLFIVLIGSGLSMAAIPVYAQYRLRAVKNQSNENWEFMSSFISSITAMFLLATSILYLAAPLVVSLLAPGFVGEPRDLTISLFRIMVLTLAFLGPEAGLRTLFHSHRAFVTPDLSRFAYNMILLSSVIFLEDRLGIEAIGWGMVAGAGIMISIQVAQGFRLGLLHKPILKIHPAVGRILRQVPAVMVILAWPMIVLLIDRAQVSGEAEGTLSSLGYASRIVMLPIGIIVIPLASVLYPRLAELSNEGSRKELGVRLTSGLRTVLFLVLPICVVMFVARTEIIQLLFERGKFDAVATERTSRALLFYTFSVPGMAIAFFLRNAYLALDRSWSLCWISLCSWVFGIALNALFFEFSGASGIAAATAVSVTITSTFMVRHLVVHCGVELAMGAVVRQLLTVLGLAGAMGAVLATTWSIGQASFGGDSLGMRLATLGPLAFGSLILYAAAARAAAVDEALWLFDQARSFRFRRVES